ncbi:MAG TPA: hexameric tyrosine-coordinated heme protein [Gracilimonas sp.]|uniref:hexameric tyrosine-coordinated heme protein n=1 Tax=Gracilimonas sp. TaxID=1974203 RepID=UPI002D927B5F|nr:hexameric tyrosine-coordinated heme protein [Gracilimonas sp.]
MIKYISVIGLLLLVFVVGTAFVVDNQNNKEMESAQNDGLTLITDTPEEGFAVAVQLARKGVTTTQPDKDVLFMLRDVYSKDPDALIASSEVIAIHYQTVAAANDYWRD